MPENSKITSWIIYIGICAALVIVPLAFTTYTQNIVLIKPTFLHLISTFIFFVFIIDCILKKEFFISDNPLALPLVAFLLMGVISTIITPFKNYCLEEMASFISYFIIIFLTAKFVDTRKRIRIIVWLIVFIVTVSVGYAVLQLPFVDMDPVNWGGQKPYVSFYGNKNFFAGVMVNLFPIVLGLMLTRKYAGDIILFLILLLITLYTVFYSKTRSVIFLGLPAAIFFFVLAQVFWGRLKFLLKKNIIVPFLIAILGTVIVFGIVLAVWPDMRGQFTSVFQTNYGTNLVRVRMWTGSWRMTVDKPIFGQGIGSYQLTFPKFRPTMYHRSGVSHNTRHSHCEFLEHLSETGIVGFGIFIWILVTYFYFSIKFIATTKDEYLKQIAIGCVAGTLSALADNLAGVNMRWHSDAFVTYFVMGLTMALLLTGRRSEEEELLAEKKKVFKKKIQQNYGMNMLVIPLIIIFVVLYAMYFIRLKTIWDADRLLKLGMGELEYAGGEGGTPNIPPDRIRQILMQAREHLLQSLDLNDNEMSTLYKLGYALLRDNDLINALNMYLAIVHNLAPNYAQIHNNIGLLYRQIAMEPTKLKEALDNKYFFDGLIREETLNKFPVQKQMEILQRVFTYKSVLQFEWATTLENNQRNQANMAQLNYHIGKYDNALYHFNKLKRVCLDEITKNFMLIAIDRTTRDIKNDDNWQNVYKNTYIAEYNNNKQQYSQCLNQIAMIYLNNFKNFKFAYEYIFKISNFNFNDIQTFWQLAAFMFQNKNDNVLCNLLNFRLAYIDRNNLSEFDRTLLSQMLQQLNLIVQNRQEPESKQKFNYLIAKVYYDLNDDTNAKITVENILKENPNNREAKGFLNIIVDKNKK